MLCENLKVLWKYLPETAVRIFESLAQEFTQELLNFFTYNQKGCFRHIVSDHYRDEFLSLPFLNDIKTIINNRLLETKQPADMPVGNVYCTMC